MTGTEILGLVTGAYDVLKSVSLRIIDLFAMGKVDQTKAAELKAEYEKAALNFDFQVQQAGLWLTEKMMVGAPWIKPLAMTTGIAIVFACTFNLACKSLGWGTYSIEFASTEMIILLGMFVYVTSGSNKALLSIIEWLMERRKVGNDAGNKPPSGDVPPANNKEQKLTV